MKKIITFLFLLPVISFAQNNSPFVVNGFAEMVFQNDTVFPQTTYTELGIGNVRVGVFWQSDDPNSINWTPIDRWADFYANTNVEPIIIFQCVQEIPDTSIVADTTGWTYCEKQNWENWHANGSVLLNNGNSYYPQDTILWKEFLTAFVDRYDGDGQNDYNNLVYPFKIYQFEAELERVWCKEDSLWYQEFVDYVNLGYNTIKQQDPTSIVKYGGYAEPELHLLFQDTASYAVDSIKVTQNASVDKQTFYAAASTNNGFLSKHSRMMYILQNAATDVYDIHLYGMAEWLPFHTKAMKNIFGNKPLWALEGGGPWRDHFAYEIFNPTNGTGYLSSELLKENASYVVRYYIGGIGSGFSKLAWNANASYTNWGQKFGDMALYTINNTFKKPAYWTYGGLSDLITGYDSIVAIPDNIYWNNSDIVGYEALNNGKTYWFLWNLNDSVNIPLNAIKNQLVYPVDSGDVSWDTITYNPLVTNNIAVTRTAVILEMDGIVLSVDESIINDAFKFNIYPNPADENITIQWDAENNNQEVLYIRVLNAIGQSVYSNADIHQQNGSFVLNTNGFPNGVYFIELGGNTSESVKKIIINH